MGKIVHKNDTVSLTGPDGRIVGHFSGRALVGPSGTNPTLDPDGVAAVVALVRSGLVDGCLKSEPMPEQVWERLQLAMEEEART